MEEEENEDSVKDFSGLFTEDSNYKNDNEIDDTSSEKTAKKEHLRVKKEKNKDICYSTLDAESSAEEMDFFDSRNSGKIKKTKSFKFLQKREKEDKEDKKKKDEKDDKKKEKRKEKEFRRREKEEKRRIKKDKKKKITYDEENISIFGIPLSIAVERCPSHDGVRLPAIVRDCIDFVEEKGLSCEGIYRIGAMKSKVQSLRRAYNCGEVVKFDEQHPHAVASLLKQYLRELPETVLTVNMMPHFEDVSLIPNPKERAEAMRQLIDRLPTPNRLLLQYMLRHMGNVIAREKENKMSHQIICVVLSPTMQISHRVLNVMFHSHEYLFGNVVIKKYVPPITSYSLNLRSIDDLQSPQTIEEELCKQESLLASLHTAVASGRITRKTEEQLWEAQRNHTLLKRRLKMYDRKEADSVSNGGSESSQEKEKVNFYLDSQGDIVPPSSRKMSITAQKDDVVSVDSPYSGNITEELPSEPVKDKALVLRSIKSEGDSQPASDQEKNDAATDSDNDKGMIESNCITIKDKESLAATSTDGTGLSRKESTSNVSVVKDVAIPVLPKPISVRAIRNKMAQEEREFNQQYESCSNQIAFKGHVVPVKPDGAVYTHRREIALSVKPATASVSYSEKNVPEGVYSSSSCTVTSIISKDSQSNNSPVPSATKNTSSSSDQPPNSSKIISTTSLNQSREFKHVKNPWKDTDSSILMHEELRLHFEHDELLAMNQELMGKLKAEKAEIAKLRDEIQEMQTIYGYRTHIYDSSESEGSDSEGESDTEEDILKQIALLDQMNERIQKENCLLLKKIGEERESVIHLRVALKESKFEAGGGLSSLVPS